MQEKELNKEEARQGETGFGMRWVLIISIVAAVIALAVVFATMM
ncbi:hypothetical protein WNY37_10000 [Henriciella sp. AS95]